MGILSKFLETKEQKELREEFEKYAQVLESGGTLDATVQARIASIKLSANAKNLQDMADALLDGFRRGENLAKTPTAPVTFVSGGDSSNAVTPPSSTGTSNLKTSFVGNDNKPLYFSDDFTESAKTFTAEKRTELAKSGAAESDGSFPIEDSTDLSNAIRDWGRAGAKESDKSHIIKRAKALGLEDKLPDTWNEALHKMPATHEEAGQKIDKAIQNKHGYGMYRQETHDDHVIARDHTGNKTYKIPYKFDKDGDCMLGDKQEVESKYVPVKESITTQFLESADKEGKEWDVLLIQEGMSKNGKFYSKEALEKAAPLFEGVYSYSDHQKDSERRELPERSIKDKVGRFTESHYGEFKTQSGEVKTGIGARFKVVAPWLRGLLLESVNMKENDFVGLSIDARGVIGKKEYNGTKYNNFVESIDKVYSVDVVTQPAAGGEFIRLVASNRGESNLELTQEQLDTLVAKSVAAALKESAASTTSTELLDLKETIRINNFNTSLDSALSLATGLSDLGKKKIRESLGDIAKRRTPDLTEVTSSIKEQVEYEAAIAQKYGGYRSVPFTERIKMGHDTGDKYDLAIRGLFEGVDQKDNTGSLIPRFRNLKEAYGKWTGKDSWEIDMQDVYRDLAVNYSSRSDHKKIRESVTLTQWGNIFADHLYIQLMKAYNNAPYGAWTMLCSDIQEVPDFQTQHWIRTGGYSDLSAVAEEGTYPLLTSPSDEEVKFSVAKKGGIDDVSFEAIVNDRVNSIRRIPLAMGRSAARTLYKFAVGLVTDTNPTQAYDTFALYDSAHHANADTNPLSVSAVSTGWQKMRAQTAFGESSEILGMRNTPKIMIVNNSLEFVARRIINPSDAYFQNVMATTPGTTDAALDKSIDPQAFKGKLDLLVYDQASGTTEWFLVADPQEVPTLVMGFLNGNRDPELFVQDQPTVGAVFTADKISYKVRHIYGGVIEDYRSFYKGNN